MFRKCIRIGWFVALSPDKTSLITLSLKHLVRGHFKTDWVASNFAKSKGLPVISLNLWQLGGSHFGSGMLNIFLVHLWHPLTYIAIASWCHVRMCWLWLMKQVKHPEYPEKWWQQHIYIYIKDERKRAPRIRSMPHKHAFTMGFGGFLNLLLASTTWESIDAPLDSRLVSGVSHKASTGNKSKLLSRLGHSSVTTGGRAKLLNAVSRNDQSQNMSESYHDCQKKQQGHNGRTMDSNLVQICPEILFI